MSDLKEGEVYILAGCRWMCTKVYGEDAAEIIMVQGNPELGFMGGRWPGFIKNGRYSDEDFVYTDVSPYYSGLSAVYDKIKSVEALDSGMRLGLYLLPKDEVSDYRLTALEEANKNYKSFKGASVAFAWLGTVGGSSSAYYVYSGRVGYGNGSNQSSAYVVAPAFFIRNNLIYTNDKNEIIVKSA